MGGYAYDDLLDRHLEKRAFLGAMARMAVPAAKGAFQFGKSFMGYGGSGIAGMAGTAAHIAAPVVSHMVENQNGASIHTPLGTAKLSSFSPVHRAVNAASYAAFALPYLSKTVHDNSRLSTALNAAGLLGLGSTAASSYLHGEKPAAYDLAGLGMMGAGMLHDHLLSKSPVPHP